MKDFEENFEEKKSGHHQKTIQKDKIQPPKMRLLNMCGKSETTLNGIWYK